MKKFVVLGLAVCLSLGLMATVASAKTVKWLANSSFPPSNHQTVALQEFSDKVQERTGGALAIEVQAGGALGYKGPELLKAVRDGLVHVSDTFTGGVAGDEPVFGIGTLPFLVNNFKEARLLSKVARPYFDETAEKWNQKILYISPWPSTGIWAKKPLHSVADMKGLKTRTYDKSCALVVEATGGTPYALPFSEVYSSLATGLIDSVICSASTAVDGKFWEVLTNFSQINVTIAMDMVVVNKKAFDKLTPEVQKVLVDTGKEMEDIMWDRVVKIDAEKQKVCMDKGIQQDEVSAGFQADLVNITEGIRDEWIAKAPENVKKLYAEYMEQVKELRN